MRTAQSRFKTVPLLDLSRQFSALREEVLAAIERVCASQHFILGPEVEALEREVAALTGAKHAVGCASGTDALWLALVATGIGPGDRVITTAFSFFASASSIVRAGAEPVFVDVDPQTLNIDPEGVIAALRRGSSGRAKTKRRSGKRLKGLLPVHLYGQSADMDALREIAQEHGLVLLEDAAQAIGAKWQGKPTGSLGKAAAFSFYPTKNLSAYGEAGIVTTADQKVAERMRRLRNHGSPERYLHTELGWNARMDAIQAAVLRVKLKYIEQWNQKRRERAAAYDCLLAEAGLGGKANVQTLNTRPEAFHVFHQYVIRARRRDQLRKFLSARGIATEVYYPLPLHLQPALSYLGYKKGALPESERAANETLALPMFPELTDEEQVTVVETIAEFYS